MTSFLLAAPGAVPVRVARALFGALLGLALGLAVTLGIVVGDARVDYRYIESTDDLMNWRAVPAPAGLVAGATAGWGWPGLLAAGGVGGLAGGGIGVLAGAVVGEAVSDRRSGPWAGGVLGGALGILLGVTGGLIGAVRGRRRRSGRTSTRAPGRGAAARTAGVLLLASAGMLTGCSDEVPPLPDVPSAPPADAGEVESVLLFFGDPGKARYMKFPILPKMAREVETWSSRLERDSAVVVVALGDIIYPDGMHDPGSQGYAIDSARVASQIDVVRGEEARRAGARMFFVAGNHDWGLREHRVGTRRLKNLGSFVDRVREREALGVDLVPDAGTGMPYVVDVGNVRLVLLDTAWWIFDAEPDRKEEMVERVAEAMAGAGDREVLIAAHHPYATAGPHGGETTVWKVLGIRRLLARSGAMLQSLDSRVYVALRAALEDTFDRVGRPLAFVGGHEHSLQVIRHDTATAPGFSLVSGSASKLTPVGWVSGMLFGRSTPGYMRVVERTSGAVDLYVEAAPERYAFCPEDDPEVPWEQCMEEGVAAYETVFSMRLQEPDPR